MELFDYYVILPCKMGDIVYDIKGKQYECTGFSCIRKNTLDSWTVALIDTSRPSLPYYVPFDKFRDEYFSSLEAVEKKKEELWLSAV